MALDWKKEVSLGKHFKGSKKTGSSQYPSKTTMNLYVVESGMPKKRIILVGILLFLLVVLFVKFGVIDQYARLHSKEAQLVQQTQTLNQVESQLTNYDEVLATYQGFASTGDANAVDAISVFDLISTQVMPYASVSSVALKDDVLTLTVSGASLTTVGDITARLTSQDMVKNVSVSNASNSTSSANSDVATITMQLSNGNASASSSNSSSTGSSSTKSK